MAARPRRRDCTDCHVLNPYIAANQLMGYATMASDLIPRDLLRQVARRFRLLGEPVRLEILSLLHTHGEMNVQELVEATGQSQANVSKHLGLLVEDGIIRRRKDGLYAYFCIDDPSLSGLCLLVCGQIRGRGEG